MEHTLINAMRLYNHFVQHLYILMSCTTMRSGTESNVIDSPQLLTVTEPAVTALENIAAVRRRSRRRAVFKEVSFMALGSLS